MNSVYPRVGTQYTHVNRPTEPATITRVDGDNVEYVQEQAMGGRVRFQSSAKQILRVIEANPAQWVVRHPWPVHVMLPEGL